MSSRCTRQAPGHELHWIQVKNATETVRAKVIKATAAGWITLEMKDGSSRRVWNHDNRRLDPGMVVEFSESFSLIRGPGGQVISVSRRRSPCSSSLDGPADGRRAGARGAARTGPLHPTTGRAVRAP